MVKKHGIEKITIENTDKLELLLKNAGDALKTFRYYKNRSFHVLNNHFLTIIYNIEDKPVAYGHLDFHKNKIWLGVMVIESKIGLGYGKKVLDYLISYSINNGIKNIFLTVDRENLIAYRTFKRYGFIKTGISETNTIIMKRENDG